MGPLFKSCFPDSKIAQNYSAGKDKIKNLVDLGIVPGIEEEILNILRET